MRLAVLDNNFRVRGTTNLRVVDASVFPYIPGFFIVTSIYMIAEKASEVILADAKHVSGMTSQTTLFLYSRTLASFSSVRARPAQLNPIRFNLNQN